MAGLAILVTVIILFMIVIGPLTYLMANTKFKFLIHFCCGICILVGLNFLMVGGPIWYIGLVPLYFAYLTLNKNSVNQKL
jgi:hypothetical protein